jgi:beta-lactamase class A
MHEQRQASGRVQMKWGPSFFIVRTMVIGVLVIVGSVTLLPTGRAAAKVPHLPNRSAVMNAVVYDVTHGRYFTYGTPGQFIVASSMKVPIMFTFLDMIERQGRGPTAREMGLLTTMIENSNNASASALYYGEIGGAAGVTRFMQRIGVSGLYPNPSAWGYSRISPQTMVSLLIDLYEGSILTRHDRQLAFYLMEHVEADQRAGVGDTAPAGATVALKDGWVPGPDGLWAVNSSGIVMTSRETYIIAVYTQEEPSLGAGLTVIRQICRTVASRLA